MRRPLFAAALSGCDTVDPPAFEEEIVVEGYLEAGQPVGYVTVSRTLPVNETYDPAVQGVPDATVRIELLENGGNGVETSWDLFAPRPASGRYRTREVVDVLPLRAYRLVVDVPGAGTVTSETTVPALFRFVDTEERTFVYDADEAPLFEITEPFYPGRQSIFLITTVSLEPDTTNLTPFRRCHRRRCFYASRDLVAASERRKFRPDAERRDANPVSVDRAGLLWPQRDADSGDRRQRIRFWCVRMRCSRGARAVRP